MNVVETYKADIYVGLRPAYKKVEEHILNKQRQLVFDICQKYCDVVGLGLTFTDTTFIYTEGNEPGIIVGLINYPRFPTSKDNIQMTAIALAEKLLRDLQQERLSIIFSNKTIMLEREDYERDSEDRKDGDQ